MQPTAAKNKPKQEHSPRMWRTKAPPTNDIIPPRVHPIGHPLFERPKPKTKQLKDATVKAVAATASNPKSPAVSSTTTILEIAQHGTTDDEKPRRNLGYRETLKNSLEVYYKDLKRPQKGSKN